MEFSLELSLMGLTVIMRWGKMRISERRYIYVVLPTRTEIVRSLMLTGGGHSAKCLACITAFTAHDDPERCVFSFPWFIPAEDLARGLRLHAVETRGWENGQGYRSRSGSSGRRSPLLLEIRNPPAPRSSLTVSGIGQRPWLHHPSSPRAPLSFPTAAKRGLE